MISGLDLEGLARWLEDHGHAGSAVPVLEPLTGGASNEVYRVTFGARPLVLRRPPAHLVEQRSATMMREARVLGALADTDVPHPRLVGASDDPSAIGSAFYVMELVDGWSPLSAGRRGPAPFDSDPDARRELGLAIVDGIAALASVDWRAAGLDGFGRPDGFHERQVPRWTAHLEKVRFRDIPGLDEAAAWLAAHRPRAWAPGVLHGDYSFANVMFGHGRPGGLAAIVDWEMSTVGDPLLDLGWLLMRWPCDDGPRPRGSFDMDAMPTVPEVLERYAVRSGRPVDDIDYYLALAAFKNAAVLEAGYAAWVAGTATNPKMEAFGDMVLEMAQLAASVAGRSALPALR